MHMMLMVLTGGVAELADRSPCPDGETTVASGAESADECLCVRGYYRSAASGNCEPCQVGSYQTELGREECLPCAANYTTHSTGSSSNASCVPVEIFSGQHAGDDAKENVTAATVVDVPTLTWNVSLVNLPKTNPTSQLRGLLEAGLLDALADSARIEVRAIRIRGWAQSRRLQSAETSPTILIVDMRFRSVEEAAIALSDLDMVALESQVQANLRKDPLTADVALQLSVPLLAFSPVACPVHTAIPPGITPLSTDECECTPGYGFDVRAGCQACLPGEYKGAVALSLIHI